MGAILAFFTGPLGKIAIYAIGAIFAAGLITAAWAHYDGLVRQVAQLKAANAQYEQTIKDDQEQIAHAEAITVLQGTTISDLQTNIEVIQGNYKTLEDYLNSKEAQAGDRPSSDVLKQTIRKLKELQK